MKFRFSAVLVALALLFAGTSARTEVVDASEAGFSIRHQIAIKAPPQTVWRMLVGHVGEWWNRDHTYSGASGNLYIEQRPLGCFCESLGEEGAVVHLTVTFVNPGKMLRLTGGLGPLGLLGVDGNMTFSLASGDGVTFLKLDYVVGGYSPDGLESLAAAVDGVLGEQIARLRLFVETGKPDVD